MKTLIKLLVIATAVSACSMDPYKKIEGLQGMHVTHRVVEPDQIFTECKDAGNINILNCPLACAKIRFDEHTCVMVTATNSTKDIIHHEELHCQGYDHDTGIEELYDAWVASGGKRADQKN